MVSVQSVWRQVPDPRGKQGLEHPLHALPGLMLLSMLSGRKGMMAAGQQGRGLTARQLRRPGFRPGLASPCHATLTETLRVLDPTAMAQAFGQLTAETGAQADTDTNHLSLDGKTLRGGKAEHVLSAFCVALDQSVGPVSSRGKGMEIPDALLLIDQLDLTDKIVTSARKQSLQRSWGRAAMVSCR